MNHPRPAPPRSHHVAHYYSPNHHPHHHQHLQHAAYPQHPPQRPPQHPHQHMYTPPQPQPQPVRRHLTPISAAAIPHFNLSQFPQIPVVIPPANTNGILPSTLGATPIRNPHHNLHVMSTHRPILTQSTTNNAFTHNALSSDVMQQHAVPPSNLNIAQTLPNISYREPLSSGAAQPPQPAPPKPPSPAKQASQLIVHRPSSSPAKPPRSPMQPTQPQKQLMAHSTIQQQPHHSSPSKSSTHSHRSHTTPTTIKSRKRSISEIKDDTDPNVGNLEGASKRRKLNTERKIARSTATNRVWRQTRQNAKFRMAIELLDGFRADHGGKLPSLRAIMKMLKVGFPKAHEILDEYAKHVGCSKDKLVEDMTIRQEKKNKNDIDGNRKKRMNRNIFEYPINVNGKLQEIILNLLHQKKVGNTAGCTEMYNKMEKSVIEFEGFYNKFGLNDKLRLAQSYFMLSSWCLYEQKDYEQSYEFMEKALSTFRDCNYLAMAAGFSVATIDHDTNNTNNNNNNNTNGVANPNHPPNVCPEDVGFFWPQIFEVYILGGHILLDNRQYYDAKSLYMFAYELVKYVMGAPPMCACIALEHLSHVCKLENNINASADYIEEIIKILSTDSDAAACAAASNVDVDDDGSGDGNEFDGDHSIKLLNVRAYYSCLLSLHCFENGNKYSANNEIEFTMNKAMQIYHDVVKECVVKYGETHAITIGVYLYFALHFVNIEKFDFAFDHIEYIMKHTFLDATQERKLNKSEKILFQYVLNGFMDRLLSFDDNDASLRLLFNNGELKEKCLKIFEYQLLSADDINHYVLNIQQIQNAKQEEESKQALIKKEESKQEGGNPAAQTIKKEKNGTTQEHNSKRKSNYHYYNKKEELLTFIDKNDLILHRQMRLLLHKFRDYDRVQQFIDNFENNQIGLKPAQRETIERMKAEFKAMKENEGNGSNHNNNHNSHHHQPALPPPYDFNILPNFLPVTAPKSMS